jgi:hypothetical protein
MRSTTARAWINATSVIRPAPRLYVGNDDGTMTVLRAGRKKELLTEIDMMAPLYSRPAPSGDALYVATMTHLYFIAVKAQR